MAASTGRSNRFAKALERRAQLQEQEKKGKPIIYTVYATLILKLASLIHKLAFFL